MKFIKIIFAAFINAYMPSADPNLFGSNDRREGYDKLAEEYKVEANKTQAEIDALKSENPFESAAAKSAMTKAKQTSTQMYNRLGNMMGGNASSEALVAAQGNLNQGIGSAAGQIATGAEANKNNQLNVLAERKRQFMSSYGSARSGAQEQKGSGAEQLFDQFDSISSAGPQIGIGSFGG